VFGPAVERTVSLNEPTYFVVDCSDAGPGALYIIAAGVCSNLFGRLSLTYVVVQWPVTVCSVAAGHSDVIVGQSYYRLYYVSEAYSGFHLIRVDLNRVAEGHEGEGRDVGRGILLPTGGR